jgi:hypothetical protein
MTDSTISNLPAGAPAQPSDQIPIARGGANYSLTAQDVANLAPADPGVPAYGSATNATQINNGSNGFGATNFYGSYIIGGPNNSQDFYNSLNWFDGTPQKFPWFSGNAATIFELVDPYYGTSNSLTVGYLNGSTTNANPGLSIQTGTYNDGNNWVFDTAISYPSQLFMGTNGTTPALTFWTANSTGAVGSTVPFVQALAVDKDGGVFLGDATGGSCGIGAINTGNYYLNGQKIAAGVMVGTNVSFIFYDNAPPSGFPGYQDGGAANFIGNGQNNYIGSATSGFGTGSYNFIGCGTANTIANDTYENIGSFIGAGLGNTITGGSDYSAIIAGNHNVISGSNGFIASGANNSVTGNTSSASGEYALADLDNTTAIGANNTFGAADAPVLGGAQTETVVYSKKIPTADTTTTFDIAIPAGLLATADLTYSGTGSAANNSCLSGRCFAFMNYGQSANPNQSLYVASIGSGANWSVTIDANVSNTYFTVTIITDGSMDTNWTFALILTKTSQSLT